MRLLLNLIAAVVLSTPCHAGESYLPRDGDLVFQTSRSTQSDLVAMVTYSEYTHMGVVRTGEDGPRVFEAAGTVRLTPLAKWIGRGRERHVLVMRLAGADSLLTPAIREELTRIGEEFLGRDYDRYFEWSDERMYCSELVWKLFDRALGIELGEPVPFGSYDEIMNPDVQAEIRRRWGDRSPDPDEPVISPRAILESGHLIEVYRR